MNMHAVPVDHERTSHVARDVFARDNGNHACWSRALPSGLADALLRWTSKRAAAFDEVVRPSNCDLTRAIQGLSASARDWVMADVTMLLGRFGRLTRASRLRVWFGAVRTDRCRKFHVDYLRYRLVTTYLGPGTEWLPDGAVCREALDEPWDCPEAANARIVRDSSQVRRAAPGDVLVMRGAVAPHLGAVHRSPPIDGTGKTRVVLIASTVDAG
jgi:hypothetical protein